MRVEVTTFRSLSGGTGDGKTQVSVGVLGIDEEFVQELDARVPVARLTSEDARGPNLLQPLVDVNITELSDSRFVLTGTEIRGASRFAQGWSCHVLFPHDEVGGIADNVSTSARADNKPGASTTR